MSAGYAEKLRMAGKKQQQTESITQHHQSRAKRLDSGCLKRTVVNQIYSHGAETDG